jgi:3-deoxy-D-manno-octulosonate 8-phosphate phosphatase (KDO 8-P phosphatase)
VRERLAAARLLVLDVDGVLTDGSLRYTRRGEEGKTFSVRDGLGIRLLLQAGLAVAVVSGRRGEAVAVRCRELGLPDELVIQGSRDKAADLDALERRLGLADAAVAAIGDDLPDLPLLVRVGVAVCPADADPEVVAVCHLVCRAAGGKGAVREVAELILKVQGRWQELVGRWTGATRGDTAVEG